MVERKKPGQRKARAKFQWCVWRWCRMTIPAFQRLHFSTSDCLHFLHLSLQGQAISNTRALRRPYLKKMQADLERRSKVRSRRAGRLTLAAAPSLLAEHERQLVASDKLARDSTTSFDRDKADDAA